MALDALAKATVIISIDLAITYHEIAVNSPDIERIAFFTNVGLQVKVKMFLVFATHGRQKRLIACFVQNLINRICLADLDEVIVLSKRLSYHVANFFCGVQQNSSSRTQARKVVAVC